MSEKLKSSELRRALNIMNSQCTDFFNAYMMNLQKCIQRTDLEITMPGDLPADHNRAGTSSAITQGPIPSRPAKVQQLNDTNGPITNILNTIMEESVVNTRFQVDDPLVSSTPLVPSVLRDIQNLLPTPEEVAEETSTAASVSETFVATPKRASSGARPSIHQVSEETSSEDELGNVTVRGNSRVFSRNQNNTRRQNITADLRQDEETINEAETINEEEIINEEESTVDVVDTADVTQVDLSISKYPLKELSVNINKLNPTISILDCYRKSFAAPRPEERLEEDEDEPGEENVRENTREVSVDSTLSTTSYASTAASTSKATTSSKQSRRALRIIPRRSKDRPKRKAVQVLESDDESNDESDANEPENFKENVRETSVESSMSTTSTATTNSKVSRKRKALTDIPRRSTGRPKRKARMQISSLAETPLNRKMRRSK